MISLRQLTLQRGGRPLLEHVDLTIFPGQKVGITGANGCGKSSLFALLRGELHADGGEVELPARLTIAHVAQETPAIDQPAIEYVLAGDGEWAQIDADLAAAELAGDGHAIAEAHHRLDAIDGYSARSRAGRLLHGLGFSTAEQGQTVTSFSGGWRMRLNLARALMCRSDLLLLDEPTNHLDLDAVLWLEQYLRRYSGTLLLISHDRDFLDNVVDNIAHVEQRGIVLYAGNYAQFERQRAERLAAQQSIYERQQREIAHMHSFVERFRAKASKARQAQSRLKALARMEMVAAAHVDSPFRFEFRAPDRIPYPLLSVTDAQAGYAGRVVIDGLKISLEPGARIGLLGRNGAGKSTLIKTLAGVQPLLAGERVEGDGLRIGYFAQHQLELLRGDDSALAHLRRVDRTARESDLRSFIGGFGFSGDDATRAVAPFSGGEKARLVLAMLVWQKPNLLLLDEPTNHLDLDMRDALTMALQEYTGALVVVSHDRHLLRATTDSFLLVADGRAQPFDGDLDDYRNWLTSTDSEEPASKPAAPAPRRAQPDNQEQARQRKPLERKLKDLEKKLDKLQADKAAVEAELADAALYTDANRARMQEALARQTSTAAALAEVEAEWLAASEALERLAG